MTAESITMHRIAHREMGPTKDTMSLKYEGGLLGQLDGKLLLDTLPPLTVAIYAAETEAGEPLFMAVIVEGADYYGAGTLQSVVGSASPDDWALRDLVFQPIRHYLRKEAAKSLDSADEYLSPHFEQEALKEAILRVREAQAEALRAKEEVATLPS